MRLLLDTQMLIWLASDRGKLSAQEQAALAGGSELLASALSLMELRIKTRAQRRRGHEPTLMTPADAIAFCRQRDIAICPVAADVLIVVLDEEPEHGDLFDELLLAHAQLLRARLLTRDSKLLKHPLAYQP